MLVQMKRNRYADHLPRVKSFYVETTNANFAVIRAVWCCPHYEVIGIEPVAV
jgi:hypothetical protein